MALTEKQRRFVDEYLVDLNAEQAAIRAGYSPKNAAAYGYRLRQTPEVQAEIRRAQRRRQRRVEITQDRVLQEYARLAFFDPRKLFAPDGSPKSIAELDEDTAAALTGLDLEEREPVGHVKKYRLANKLAALDSVARYLGMLDKKGAQKPDGDDPITKSLKESADVLKKTT